MIKPSLEGTIFGVIRGFLMVVGLPTLAALVYFGFIASDIYVSEARFAIRNHQATSQTGDFAWMLNGSSIGLGGMQDAMVVSDYINSREMLDRLQSLHLREHYSNSEADWLARLDPDASKEDFLEYFKHKIEVLREESTNIITLKTKAFSPEMALAIANYIITLSEELINKMSERIEEDALSFARGELDRTKAKVHVASRALTQFRNEHESIDPAEKTSAVLGIVTSLEQKLAETKAELSEARGYMRESSANIKALKNRITALEKQSQSEKNRLAGNHGEHLSSLIEAYQPLMLEQELSREHYTAALASLEAARLDAQRKQRYLITFIPPAVPDEAVEPRRVWNVITVAVGAFLIYVIGGLMWAALKDHMSVI